MKNFITNGIEDAVYLQRSPVAEGVAQGTKAALIGAPVGALVNALRGKDPLIGSIIGALSLGIPAALAGSTSQKLSNLDNEAIIRHHAKNIKKREPAFFMPPPEYFGPSFRETSG